MLEICLGDARLELSLMGKARDCPQEVQAPGAILRVESLGWSNLRWWKPRGAQAHQGQSH
jgi:hypothetical protein